MAAPRARGFEGILLRILVRLTGYGASKRVCLHRPFLFPRAFQA